jgi:hypothetical protein
VRDVTHAASSVTPGLEAIALHCIALRPAGLSLAVEIAEVFAEKLKEKGMGDDWIDLLVSRCAPKHPPPAPGSTLSHVQPSNTSPPLPAPPPLHLLFW